MQQADGITFIIERMKAGARLSDPHAPLGQCWVLEEPGKPVDVVTAQEMRRLVVEGFVETDKKHSNYLARLTPRNIDSTPPTTRKSFQSSADEISHKPIAPAVQPYTFEQLLDRETGPTRINLIFHLHVPKAGGKTVVALLCRNQGQNAVIPLEFDMATSSFFGLVPEDRWLSNYEKAGAANPFLMTGHFRMDALTLRNAPIPHAVVTTLRDPIVRVLSHYNYTLRVPGNPWRNEVISGDMSFLEYAETLLAPNGIGPQYSFFDDTGVGTFARSGTASVQHCFDNLLNKVCVFGLIERFDEFAALAAYLLRSDGALVAASQNVTRHFADTSGIPLKTSLTDEERSKIEQMFGDDIWFYEAANKEYERRISDPRLHAVIASAAPLLKTCREKLEEINQLPSWQSDHAAVADAK
jgi:hypothetical protein